MWHLLRGQPLLNVWDSVLRLIRYFPFASEEFSYRRLPKFCGSISHDFSGYALITGRNLHLRPPSQEQTPELYTPGDVMASHKAWNLQTLQSA